MRETLVQQLLQHKIIAIVRGAPANALEPLADAMFAGGIRFLEIAFDASGTVLPEETARQLAALRRHVGGRLHIGAGTVLTTEQLMLAHAAGAEFIVSPDTNPEVIRRTRELDLMSVPGALTPTEILLAHRSGADFVKLFPASFAGTDYIRTIRAPLSHVRLLAVGNVTLSNMDAYLDAGVCGFAIGGSLVSRALLKAGRFDELTALAAAHAAKLR